MRLSLESYTLGQDEKLERNCRSQEETLDKHWVTRSFAGILWGPLQSKFLRKFLDAGGAVTAQKRNNTVIAKQVKFSPLNGRFTLFNSSTNLNLKQTSFYVFNE